MSSDPNCVQWEVCTHYADAVIREVLKAHMPLPAREHTQLHTLKDQFQCGPYMCIQRQSCKQYEESIECLRSLSGEGVCRVRRYRVSPLSK